MGEIHNITKRMPWLRSLAGGFDDGGRVRAPLRDEVADEAHVFGRRAQIVRPALPVANHEVRVVHQLDLLDVLVLQARSAGTRAAGSQREEEVPCARRGCPRSRDGGAGWNLW